MCVLYASGVFPVCTACVILLLTTSAAPFFYISDGIAKKKQKCAEKKGTGKARAFQGENIKKSMSLA